MSTLNERKNYIANCLLNRGLNKTSIIAILCNGYHESAGSLSPTQHEFGGGGGFGIWQWTGNARQAEIIRYATTHSEKDAIKWECNFLVDNRPNQWINNAGMTWNEFLHNSQNQSWQRLVYVFEVSWERGNLAMASRLGAYNKIMPIDWSGAGGDNIGGDDKPKKQEKRYPTLKQCLSLFDKQHPSRNNKQDPGNTQGGGTTKGFNNKPCLDWFHRYQGHIYYSMPGRAGVYSGRSADCSSFVSYMLQLGYNDHDRTLYTTETLHDRLTRLGYKCIEQGSDKVVRKPFKTGDVIILGRRGYSSGAGGHTGICLEAPKIFDCNYTSNGLKIYSSAQYFLNWNSAAHYWYHYQKD